ncbi:MAG: TIGR02266 family protein [bacterium]
MSDDLEDGRRQHLRVRLPLQVAYRSTGSFLVSYSVDLSQGGLFLETTRPREVGTELDLRLAIPGAEEDVRLRGVVQWIRTESAHGQPPGMGIEFQDVEQSCGKLIDSLIKHFSGVRILVAATAPRHRAQLSRQLRSALAATIDEHDLSHPEFAVTTGEPYDLVAIDLGDGDEIAYQLLEDVLRAEEPIAVLAMTAHPRVRQQARDMGAQEVIGSPPGMSELRAAVLKALGRPLALRADQMEDD